MEIRKRPSVLSDTINDLEAFTSLDIKIDYADISIQPSDHWVEYQLSPESPVIQVKDGQLMVRDGKRNNSSPVMFLSGFNMTFRKLAFRQKCDCLCPADTYFTSCMYPPLPEPPKYRTSGKGAYHGK
ncbi:MAG: hypothetical protein ACLVLH_10075 [Eisenbergiella massiliensis]